MQFPARYFDGLQARARDVVVELIGTVEQGSWAIRESAQNRELARWPAEHIHSVAARRGTLKIGCTAAGPGASPTARVVFSGWDLIHQVRPVMPALKKQSNARRRSQFGLMAASTALLAGVVGLYYFGVPLLAHQIANGLPPDWEIELGERVADQVEASLSEEADFELCDPDPNSLANRAIARFVEKVVAPDPTPFDIRVAVARSEIPNAFALPGGRVYYLSSLLVDSRTPDEFAGVLSHEIGHVVHRHGMEQLVASAGTGLLLGFMMGDMTGISVAGGIGASVIDSRHSRDAEREADSFAASAASRLGFNASALADLLERVSEDTSFTAALSLLNSHPLTTERRIRLDALRDESAPGVQAFSEGEWQAIRTMCDSASAKDESRPDLNRNKSIAK